MVYDYLGSELPNILTCINIIKCKKFMFTTTSYGFMMILSFNMLV